LWLKARFQKFSAGYRVQLIYWRSNVPSKGATAISARCAMLITS